MQRRSLSKVASSKLESFTQVVCSLAFVPLAAGVCWMAKGTDADDPENAKDAESVSEVPPGRTGVGLADAVIPRISAMNLSLLRLKPSAYHTKKLNDLIHMGVICVSGIQQRGIDL
jgi:hypothetical protein